METFMKDYEIHKQEHPANRGCPVVSGGIKKRRELKTPCVTGTEGDFFFQGPVQDLKYCTNSFFFYKNVATSFSEFYDIL